MDQRQEDRLGRRLSATVAPRPIIRGLKPWITSPRRASLTYCFGLSSSRMICSCCSSTTLRPLRRRRSPPWVVILSTSLTPPCRTHGRGLDVELGRRGRVAASRGRLERGATEENSDLAFRFDSAGRFLSGCDCAGIPTETATPMAASWRWPTK